MLTKLFRTELFHNLDYKSGCASSRFPPCPCCASRCSLPLLRCGEDAAAGMLMCAARADVAAH
jgi:hypothetical protein